MKKNIFSVVALFAFAFGFAQDVKFGAKAALNISSLTGDVVDASSIVGFQVGGFAEFKLSEKFAFQPELMYSFQGTKESGLTDLSGTLFIDRKTKLGYLNLPLMLKYYATPKFSLEFGPQVGFLLSAKADIDISGTFIGEPVSGSSSSDVKDQVNSVDYGFNFGLGYDITENFVAGLRYNLGLSTVYDIDHSDESSRNSVFSISLGYKF